MAKNAMQKFECNGCGGHLKEDGRFWVCENCGTKYALGRNDEGDPFTYQPIEKKEEIFGVEITIRYYECQCKCGKIHELDEFHFLI